MEPNISINAVYESWKNNEASQPLISQMRKSDRVTKTNFLKEAMDLKDNEFVKFLIKNEFGLQDSIFKEGATNFKNTAIFKAYEMKNKELITEFCKHFDFNQGVADNPILKFFSDHFYKKNDFNEFDHSVAQVLIKQAQTNHLKEEIGRPLSKLIGKCNNFGVLNQDFKTKLENFRAKQKEEKNIEDVIGNKSSKPKI